MSWIEDDDDPFESIVRDFFGPSATTRRSSRAREKVIENEEEERRIDFVETDSSIFLIFELPGYEEKECSIQTKGQNLSISLKKKSLSNIQPYLAEKFSQELKIYKNLPEYVNTKKFSQKFTNGVLELEFLKK